ncbi:hypothetical protein [Longispora albida]|uniref:hypothetical protein n=1 Tax=Longispora albida TaxID=203523 RepID=UPI000A04D2D3|nr:hypothetical protein [Longispora albida]
MRLTKFVTVAALAVASLTPVPASTAHATPGTSPAAPARAASNLTGQTAFQPDGSQFKADFNGDSFDDVAVWKTSASGVQVDLLLGGAGGFTVVPAAWTGGAQWVDRIKFVTGGDYDNAGTSPELAFFYEEPSGRAAIYFLAFTAGNTFADPVAIWEAPNWGTGTRFMATTSIGDWSGNNVVLFYQYDNQHAALFKLVVTMSGKFAMDPHDLPNWGPGTRAVVGGDFRDTPTNATSGNIALLYDYGNGHVAVWPLSWTKKSGIYTWGKVWDAPRWGTGTRFMTAGHFTKDSVDDLALFYDYGNGHVATFVLAPKSGGFAGPSVLWDNPAWGSGTQFLTSGRFTSAAPGLDELGVYYNYGNGKAVLTTLTPTAQGTYTGPWTRWTPASTTGIRAVL